jgi:membrane protease YdiL (CAAX protease family)
MSSENLPKRAGAFLRSILPAESAHWLLLFGSTFLFISQHLRWWPKPVLYSASQYEWRIHVYLMAFILLMAGAAGYYVSFLRCRRPVLRLFTLVLLPTLASLLAIPFVGAVWFPDEIGLGKFGLGSVNSSINDYWPAIPHLLTNLGPGLQFAATGFLLIAIFTVLLKRGSATLPVHLAVSPEFPLASSPSDDENRRIMLFVWMMISLVPLASLVGGMITSGLYLTFAGSASSHIAFVIWMNRTSDVLSLFLLVFFGMGKARRQTLRESFRLPPVKYLLLAPLFPAAIASVWPLGLYVQDRIYWAISEFGKEATPQLASYFTLPTVSSSWYLAAALVEEIAWRGFLQPRFIRRYGMARGIFLLAMVWGAFHFSGDFRSSMAPVAVFTALAHRLVFVVALSYVLAWLTIRSESVLPAALAHGVFNMFALDGSPTYAPFWFSMAMWAILACVLFRYFPPTPPDEVAATDTGPTYVVSPQV